jgi:Ni/Fe-hydrogenase subunit HybB-like protein
VAGALFQGFALVLILAVPLRTTGRLRDVITMRHLENLGKMVLLTSWVMIYSYMVEIFIGWYSGNPYERFLTYNNRMIGPYAPTFWATIFCNCLVPQVLWRRKLRTSIPVLFTVAIFVSVGMWLERFLIIVGGLAQDYMPSYWAMFYPTWVDIGILFGTIGFFALLFQLFARLLPTISMAEMRELIHHHGRKVSLDTGITEESLMGDPGRVTNPVLHGE